jgi:hypothetical protein
VQSGFHSCEDDHVNQAQADNWSIERFTMARRCSEVLLHSVQSSRSICNSLQQLTEHCALSSEMLRLALATSANEPLELVF